MSQIEADEDIEIERRVLGNILVNPEVVHPLIDFLCSKDFNCIEHQAIYETILSLHRQGELYDFITVTDELEKRNKLEEVGGAQYIGSLLKQVQSTDDLLPYAYTVERMARSRLRKNTKQTDGKTLYTQTELTHPETRVCIARLSPSFKTLEKLLEEQGSFLDRLHWREFEELIADLLEKDGYVVKLGRGTKDGGQDIIAMKELEGCGWFMSVWQAKKLKPNKKVELSVIRELADTRNQHKASKGIIVTSTYLTHGALERITQDQFILGKVDRDDLMRWIQRVKRR